MSNNQQTNTVIKQFEDQIKTYTDDSLAHLSKTIPIVEKYLINKKSTIKVCEFGGGGGSLLNEIDKKCDHDLELYNVELVDKYKNYQVNKKINFVCDSIINSKFNENYFDITIARNVFHHLIGDSLKQSRQNQQQAINEMLRVTKPGGIVLIEEQTNQSKLAGKLIYNLSKLASRLKIRIEKFQITPNTVIAYLTQDELKEMCSQKIKSEKIDVVYTRWNMDWYWKLTMLLRNTGSSLITIKK